MYELRVLSGHQFSAALPLTGERWKIGTSAGNHLQLSDSGIQCEHAILSCEQQTWSITFCQTERRVAVYPGEAFNVGPVWLIVCDISAPWQAAPGRILWSGAAKKRIGYALPVLLMLATMLVIWPFEPEGKLPSDKVKPELTLLTSDNITLVLKNMIRERGLSREVLIGKKDHKVILTGVLPPREMNIVARMLDTFTSRYRAPMPVINETQVLINTLPFQIKMVSRNTPPYIETSTGKMLFIGDELQGYRLTAIQEHEIELQGKETVRIKW